MTRPTRLSIWTERDRAKARSWVDRMPRGWSLIFKPPTRSDVQSRKMWAMLDEIAAQKEWDGAKRSSDAWKDLFSACLRQQEIVRGLEGGIVALGARTSEMSPEEMSDLLQLIETWGAQNGVTFSDQESAPVVEHSAERAAVDGGAGSPRAAISMRE